MEAGIVDSKRRQALQAAFEEWCRKNRITAFLCKDCRRKAFVLLMHGPCFGLHERCLKLLQWSLGPVRIVNSRGLLIVVSLN